MGREQGVGRRSWRIAGGLLVAWCLPAMVLAEDDAWVEVTAETLSKNARRVISSSWELSTDHDPAPWENGFFDLSQERAENDPTPDIANCDIVIGNYVERTTRWIVSPPHWLSTVESETLTLRIDLSAYPSDKYRGAKLVWMIPSYEKTYDKYRIPRDRYERVHTRIYRHDALELGKTNVIEKFVFAPEPWTTMADWSEPRVRGVQGMAWQVWDPNIHVYVEPGVREPANARADAAIGEVGDPVNAVNGTVSLEREDLSIPCPGIPLTFKRSYASNLDHVGTLGPRWIHSYEICLRDHAVTVDDQTHRWKLLYTATGARFAFKLQADGTYSRPRGGLLTLETCAGGYRLAVQGGMTLTFDADGVLREMGDLWENSVALQYEGEYPAHRLMRVEHDNGQYLAFGYTNDLLAMVQTPDADLGLSLRYENGGLAGVSQCLPGTDLVEAFAYDTNGVHLVTQRVDRAGTVTSWAYETNAMGVPTPRGIWSRIGDRYFDTTLDYDLDGGGQAGHGTAVFQGERFGRIYPVSPETSYHYLVDPGPEAGGDEDPFACGCMTTNQCTRCGNVTRVTTARGDTNVVHDYHVDPYNGWVLETLGPFTGTNRPERASGVSFTRDVHGYVTETRKIDYETGACLHTCSDRDGAGNVTRAGTGFCSLPRLFTEYVWQKGASGYELVSLTDAQGVTVSYAYTNGLVSTERLHVASNVTYDTTYGYDASGLLVAVTNANGHWVRHVHDAFGHPAETIPQAGPGARYEYNQAGHLLRLIQPGDVPRVTEFDHDPLGRLSQVRYPDDRSETFQVDGRGTVTGHVDRAGRTTTFSYTPTRKLASTTRILDVPVRREVTMRHHYDDLMNTLAIEDALGRQVEAYQLDLADRPCFVRNVEGQEMTVTYCIGELVASTQRFDGSCVSNRYDHSGRLVQTAYPDATNRLTYLGNGLVASLENDAGVVTNRYNSVNRLIETTGPAPSSTVGYTYWPAGQVSSVVSVAGASVFTLDGADRPTVLDAPSGAYAFSYDATNGAISEMTLPNGVTASYAYDVMDRLVELTWQDGDGGILRNFRYGYDAADMISDVTREDGTVSAYSYDSLDRLVGTRQSDAEGRITSREAFTYDLVGNRLTRSDGHVTTTWQYPYGDEGNRVGEWDTQATAPSPKPPTVFVFFGAAEKNRVVKASDKLGRAKRDGGGESTGTTGQYLHDAAGCVTNMVRDGISLSFSWDSQYRLKTVRGDDGEPVTFAYDGLGRWIWREAGGTRTYFVHDGLHVTAEVDDAGQLLRSYRHGAGVDQLLSMTDHVAGKTYFFLSDHLGSIHAAVDSTGAIVESYAYDVWGRVLAVRDGNGTRIPRSAIGNRYLWQGRWYSWETALYNFRARWYDPLTGRWLSKDPIGINGGLNQYVFCGNSPVNFRDPLGLWNLWHPTTWGVPNAHNWSIWDSLNPVSSRTVGWSGYFWGASEGAAAALDGIIPIWNPLQFAYEDDCGRVGQEYKVSRFIGGATMFIELSLLGPTYAGAKTLEASGVSAGVGIQWLVGNYRSVATIGNAAWRVTRGLLETLALGVEAYGVVESAHDAFRE